MRTAGRTPPCTETRPTPEISAQPLRHQRVGEVAQLRAANRSREVSASVTIGASAGFTLA